MPNGWDDLAPNWFATGDTWQTIFSPAVYAPGPTVTVNGIDYTGDAIGAVNISRGRDTVYAQTQAGYASFELIDVDGLIQPIVGTTVRFTLNSPTGATNIPVFVGQLADWDAEAISTGGRPVIRYRLQAVGPLARLNRRTIFFDGRGQELDGTRVGAAVGEGQSSSYEEVPDTIAYGDSGASVSYETFDQGFDPNLIDQGVFQIAPLDASDGGYSSLQVAQNAASSAEGVLFETGDGFIGYADSNRRIAAATTEDLQEIPFSEVSIAGVSVSQKFADVTNRVTVEFADGAVTQTSQESVDVFGEILATRLSTILANVDAANQRAEIFLERHEERTRQLGRLTFNLRGVRPDILEFLLSLNTNSLIKMTGIPTSLGLPSFRGFVEGVDIAFSEFQAELNLFVSAEALSTGAVRWSVIPETVTYDDVDPTLKYEDARSL